MAKVRIDDLLIDKALAENKEMAKRYVMEGIVYIDNFRVLTVGEKVKDDCNLYIKENRKKTKDYVSRGGFKLEKALDDFTIDLRDTISMDIGSSTGGFTDCMLRNGAKKVYAVDVGYGQLDFKLRTDPRVVVMERTNIRDVEIDDLGGLVDFFSIDVSFISLDLVLPVCRRLINKSGHIVALIKPQFEVERGEVEDGGVIRNKGLHYKAIKKIVDLSKSLDFYIKGISYSPIKGATGNIEYLIYLGNENHQVVECNDDYIEKVVEESHIKLN